MKASLVSMSKRPGYAGGLLVDGMGQLPGAEPRPLSPMIEQMVARELVKHARRCDAYLDGGTADPLDDIEVIRDRIRTPA